MQYMKKPCSVGLVALVMIALSAGAAAAQADTYYQQLEEYVELYNLHIDRIPSPLKMFVQNERIAIQLQSDAEPTEHIGVIIDGTGRINEYTAGQLPDPTMRFIVAPGTVERLIAENSGMGVLGAFGRDIEIEGVGTASRVKALILRVAGLVVRLLPV